METLEHLRTLLHDRRLLVVAKETGIHYNTLKSIRDDNAANPTYRVVQSLYDYLTKGQACKS